MCAVFEQCGSIGNLDLETRRRPFPMHMTFLKIAFLICLSVAGFSARALPGEWRIRTLDSGQDCSIRGMSIPTNDVIWVSGSKGHVGRSVDQGRTWRWTMVAGFEKTDFRDIHAFDSLHAVIMGIGNPAYILKTRDGGRSWKPVFKKDAPGMFLDAMDFRNDRYGICVGDPLEVADGSRKFYIVRTSDGGDSWQDVPTGSLPQAADGEAVFSASGSNIALLDGRQFDYAFISGGIASNLYLMGPGGMPSYRYPLPIMKGTESSGAFSMATDRRQAFYCIGGDYKAPGEQKDLFTWTSDAGKILKRPGGNTPSGYRSCIAIIDGKRLIACGTNGVDICGQPENWTHISDQGFNTCVVSPDRKRVFFGGGGRIAMLKL
jgi:photosystem II stability/assembly factor-like uncharacterized protein